MTMGNYWKQQATRMFGPMPADIQETGPKAVRELRNPNLDFSEGNNCLRDIDEYLDEFPTNGMSRLGITQVELANWREKYQE